jgi:hypothetical protein
VLNSPLSGNLPGLSCRGGAGVRAMQHFLEFFTVNIRNRRMEVAQRMAGHTNVKTSGLYDRRNDDGRGRTNWDLTFLRGCLG